MKKTVEEEQTNKDCKAFEDVVPTTTKTKKIGNFF
jgi:uncharacterized protein YktA (UPF0223 family)